MDGLLVRLAEFGRRSLLGTIAGLCAVPVIAFATVYWAFGALRHAGGGAVSILDDFYFSLVTQATVGFGDVTPVHGWVRAVVGVQILIGVGWTAFLPAIVLAALRI